VWILAGGAAGVIIAWALVALVFEEARLNVAAPRAQPGAEASLAAIRLFCAVVLVLFVVEPAGQRRLRWVAGGFVILGFGSAVFGYLLPIVRGTPDIDASLYTSLIILSVAGLLFVVGLLPVSPPRFTFGWFLVSVFAVGVLSTAVAGGVGPLPPLVRAGRLEIVGSGILTWHEMTGWHYLLFAIPFGLAAAAAVGTVANYARGEGMRIWLVLAMVVFAGAQLHQFLWPTAYQSILTSTNLLRGGSAAIVAVGGVIELRRAAAERAALLSTERERVMRLGELAVLKADFTAMVAHELTSPISAIRGWADALSTGELDSEDQARALSVIRTESAVLNNLVVDVQAAARDEREDFAVQPQPTSLDALLAEAEAFARVLPGDHPVTLEAPMGLRVWADPVRIGQVLRNLLSNAAKYSSPGVPITLRVTQQAERVSIEVIDRGAGIDPDELSRIFEKFGRGRDRMGHQVAGVGLGLYISRRIAQMHGSKLTVSSVPEGGSAFCFELEVVEEVG
jgi:signal transduction histidine kinase